jgi:hypothetical protein
MKEGVIALTCQVGQSIKIGIVAIAGQGFRGIGRGYHQAERDEQ